MRGVSKKMFISILTSVIVMVTMVATTFAWVGIFTYANTEKVSLNLKVSDLDSYYYLTISNSGKVGSFSDEISAIDVERQVVNNMYDNKYNDVNDSVIQRIYNASPLSNVSAIINDNNTLDFYMLDTSNSFRAEFYDTNAYMKFDLYLSVNTKEGITEETTGIKANVMLNNIKDCLEGTKMYYRLVNHNPFNELPSDSIYSVLKQLPESKAFNINSKNAVRFALSMYDPIKIDDEYTDELPVKTVVYQGGNQIPNYDENDDVFDLGGILDSEYNTASKELLSVRSEYAYQNSYYNKLLNTISNRNDLELTEENNVLWDKYEHEKYLGCMNGVLTKMKITVHLWFEGWDSDCIKAIEEQPIFINLSFTSKYDEE